MSLLMKALEKAAKDRVDARSAEPAAALRPAADLRSNPWPPKRLWRAEAGSGAASGRRADAPPCSSRE